MASKRILYVVILFTVLLLSGGVLTFFMPEVVATTRLLLIAAVCVALMDTFMLGQAAARPSNGTPIVSALVPPAQTDLIFQKAVALPPTRSLAEITHELRTPINLIVGFCETLIAPVHANHQALPVSYWHDIDAIYRNAKMLQQAIENVLGALKTEAPLAAHASAKSASVERKTVSAPRLVAEPAAQENVAPTPLRRKVVVMDDDPNIVKLFERHFSQFEVAFLKNVRDIEQLDFQPTAVILTSEQADAQIPEIAHLTNSQATIITCAVPGARLPETYEKTAFLTKPVTFEALSQALAHLNVSIRDVLIIDDNRDNVEMITRMLESMPQTYRIWKTYSGREGLALMHEQRLDVIILDVLLPDTDGLVLAQYIRSDLRLSWVPILMMSAYEDPAIVSLPPVGKISILEFAGVQPSELIHHIESLVALFNL